MTNPNLVNTSQVYMRSNVQIPISSDTDILECPSSSNMIIRADTVTICNPTASAVSINVYLTRSATTYALAKTIEIPAYSSMVVLDKDYPIYLQEGDKLQVSSDSNNVLQAICSYTIISDTSITLPSRPAINEAQPATEFTLASFTNGTAFGGPASLTIPTVQDGDIGVLMVRDLETSQGGIPPEVLQTGFTRITTLGVQTSSTRQTRIGAQYKILSSSDTGTTLTGYSTSSSSNNMVLYVLRPNGTYTNVSVGSLNEEIASGNPSVQTVNVSGVSVPIASFGLIAGLNPHTPTVTNFEPVTDLKDSQLYYSTYKIQNTSPSNSTIDMGDVGTTNVLLSFYVSLVQ